MDEITLNIKSAQLGLNGKPIVIVDPVKFQKLNIRTEEDIQKNMDKLDKIILGETIVALFDVVTLPNKISFALYSDITLKIRRALQEKKDTITLSREDTQALMKIFQDYPPQQPQFNSKFAFILEELDKALEQEQKMVVNSDMKV